MKPSERRLVIILGVMIFIVINVILVNYFMKKHKARNVITQTLQKKKTQNTEILRDAKLWHFRDNWIDEVAPRFGTSEDAQGKFLSRIEGASSANGAELAQPQIRAKPVTDWLALQEVTAEVSLTGELASILGFAADLEDPDQLISVRQINVIPPAKDGDPFKGKFKISKWYYSVPDEEEEIADTTLENPAGG